MKEGWEYKKLGEVCETSSGGTPSKSHIEYYEGGTIPWLRSGEVAQGMIYDSELYITELGLKNSSAKLFPIDTVVIAMYGATVGQVGVLKKEMSTNQAICGILPSKTLCPNFLMYILKAKKSSFLKDAVGGAQANISQNIIKNTTIPVPNISEQQQIVSELDLLSEVIEKQKSQLEELDKLAQAIFYDMFGDPVMNEKGWVKSKYGDNFKISSGGTPSKTNSEYWDEGTIPWIGSNMCQNCIIYENDGKYITEKGLNNSSANILKCGTVLIALVGATIGKVALLKKEMATNQNIAHINVWDNKDFEPMFIFYHSMNLYHIFVNLGDGGFKMANQGFIRDLPLICPPLALQQEFAARVEAIELMKAKVRQSLSEAETLFNSRMDYYFN